MTHDRKLVLSGISLTQARLRNVRDIEAASEVRDDLEKEIIASGYLNGAPFRWVGISIRYGLKNAEEPIYFPISKKHGDIALAIEIDTHRILEASYEELVHIFRKATLISLLHAGRKYNLKTDRLQALLAEENKLIFAQVRQ